MLRLTTLGTLLLQGDDGPYTGRLARPRLRALLALLARAGAAGVSRDRLCALLWPEDEPDRARHSLEQALYLLRRELGSAALVGPPDTVVLDPAVLASDVADFSGALAAGSDEEAVQLYGGPFLDGFHLSEAAEFERWVDVQRNELHRLYAGALESLAEAAETHGDLVQSAMWWRRLAAAEPYSSRIVLRLMRALARAGDPGGGLEAARLHEVLLEQELGIPPDPAVAALAAGLRREPYPQQSTAPVATAPRQPPPLSDDSPSPVTPPAAAARLAPTGHSAPAPASARSAPSGPLRVGHQPALRRHRRLALVGAIVVTGLLGLLAGSFALRDGGGPAPPPPAIAVQPFANETGDRALDVLGGSVAYWIAGGLIQTGVVRVVEPGAGIELEALVSGRFYRSGDSLQVEAAVTRPKTGEVLSVLDPITASAADPGVVLEAVRSQVLAAIATRFDQRIAAWSETSLRPPKFDAYRAFAAGLEAYSAGRPEAALGAFADAAALDSAYAHPRLWAAWTHTTLGQWAAADSMVALLRTYQATLSPLESAWLERIDARVRGDQERSFRAARRMVEIAPGSGWTIALANTALDTRRPAFAREVLLSIPADALGLESINYWRLLSWADHMLGDHGLELGRANEGIRVAGQSPMNLISRIRALAALGRVGELEEDLVQLTAGSFGGVPDPARVVAIAAMELRAHGYPEEARRLLGQWIARYDDANRATRRADPSTLAMLHYLYGDVALADSLARTALTDPGDRVTPRALLGVLAAARGDGAAAARWADELAALDDPYAFGQSTIWRAHIAAVLHDHDRAIDLLRQASAEGADRFTWLLVHLLPGFEPLHALSAFRRLEAPHR